MSAKYFGLSAIVLISLMFLAVGCIPVDDLAGYWDKGVIDPELEGDWKQLGVEFRSEDSYLSFVKSGEYYLQESSIADYIAEDVPKVGIRTKTLLLGKHKFLMYDVAQWYEDVSKASHEAGVKMARERGVTIDPNEVQEISPVMEAPCKGALHR